MNRRDLIMITGIALLLLAAVSAFEMTLRGVPEVLRDFEIVTSKGDQTNLPAIDHASASATARPNPATADPTQPEATAAGVESQSATPTARG